MILVDKITLFVKGNKKIKHYKELGYDISGEFFEVSIKDITTGSRIIVPAQCDFCSKIVNIDYNSYYNNIKHVNKYACSKECGLLKTQDTNLKKYGVKYVSQLDSIKEENSIKRKKTNLEKLGVEYPMQSITVKNKLVENNIKKYGVKNVSQLQNTKNTIKNTNLEKYGVEHVFQSENVKNKIKNTCFLKYGSDNVNSSYAFRKENFKIAQHHDYINYINNGESEFACSKGHNFIINIDNFCKRIKSNTPLCTVCYPIGEQKSIKELELLDFIKSIYLLDIQSGYRDGLEIDIYLPEINIGFEFNGLYWHSEKYKDKNYHLDKSNFYKEKGIRIIHIWEDDWDLKKDIIKSQIKNLLKKSEVKLFARKCIVKEVIDTKLINKFLNDNHIQGKDYSSIKLGLFYKNELVSLMTFNKLEGRKKMNNDEWNLSRFCNVINYNVVGSASKLLNYFIKKYNPTRIISYADKCWSEGSLYYTLGFSLIHETKPDYKYIVNSIRTHKQNFSKKNLVNKGFDETLSESNIMSAYDRVWDCGKIKFELLLKCLK